MAISATTFSNAGSAVSDFSGAASDLFNADMKGDALRLKGQGDLAEASNYDLAANLAQKNEDYTKYSTEVQQQQQDRKTFMQIGKQQAAVAGSGLAASGSALDILRSSAEEGALAKETLGAQGQIQIEGYDEQEKSYQTMAAAARNDAAGQDKLASESEDAGIFGALGSTAGGILKGAAAIATLAG